MGEQRRVIGRLMYTPHPAGNRIVHVSPERLAKAARRVHQINYVSLVQVHQAIGEIAQIIADLNPSLVIFFATGGIPIVFPVNPDSMH